MRLISLIVFVALIACAKGSTGGGSPGADLPPDPPEVDAGTPPAFELSRWSWMNPSPQGTPINAFWAAAADDVWAAGDAATLMHYDGQAWSHVPLEGTAALTAVWGSSASDVWVAGDAGTLFHFDGSAWSHVASGTTAKLLDVRGTSASDVWVSGAAGTLLHFDGTGWTQLPAPTALDLGGVWPFAGGEVWLLAQGPIYYYDGAILHGDGVHWVSEKPDPNFNRPAAIWATSPTDLWVTEPGANGVLAHWDGSSWTTRQETIVCEGTPVAHSLWSTGPADVWHACLGGVEHFDGQTWTVTPAPRNTPSAVVIGGSDVQHLWGAGWMNGALMRQQDSVFVTGWANLWGPFPSDLTSIWGSSANDIWAGGKFSQQYPFPDDQNSGPFPAMFAHFDGERWSQVALPGMDWIFAIWGSGPSDVYAVGSGVQCGAWHFDGNGWSPVTPLCKEQTIYNAGGTGPDDVWVQGSSSFWHWDGAKWTTTSAGFIGTAMWTSPSGVIWSASANCREYDDESVCDRTQGYLESTSTAQAGWDFDATWPDGWLPFGIWGSSDDDIWVAGTELTPGDQLVGKPLLVHGTPATGWTRVTPDGWPLASRLFGAGSNDVWAIGAGGVAMHFDGVTWKADKTGTSFDLNALWQAPSGEVFAVGQHGAILKRPAP